MDFDLSYPSHQQNFARFCLRTLLGMTSSIHLRNDFPASQLRATSSVSYNQLGYIHRRTTDLNFILEKTYFFLNFIASLANANFYSTVFYI